LADLPHVLLITGAPATGKSRLAAELMGRFNAQCLRKDEFKETLFTVLGTGDAAWSRQLSDVSFRLLFQLAPRLLRPGRLLLLEGNFRPGEHQPLLSELVAGAGARSAQVLCVAAAATRRARLSARASDPARHTGHQDHRIQAPAADEFTYLEVPGPRFKFDSDAHWEREFAALCNGLKSWYCANL
jgi:predicted kinase